MHEHLQIIACYAGQIKALLDLMETTKGADIESINVTAEMCLNMFDELLDEVEKMAPKSADGEKNIEYVENNDK